MNKNLVVFTPKQTVENEVQESVVGVLKEYLAKAEAGQLNCVIVIAGFLDGMWTDDMSSTLDFPTAIGRLEIAKQEWIAQELNSKED